MHVPIRVDYGVRALIDLAQHAGSGPIHAADIARRQSIPEPYLARLLHTMSKEGLVKSHTGPQGGHVLAAPPSQITLGMVMRTLGGMETVIGCLDDPAVCVQVPSCSQREVWRIVEEAMLKILDSTTIADLLERTAVPA
ncbi:MAG: Rrf2 family transcriptional regulator [Dehalococcoidia bacterium]|nr:Rrf2 family transcriptional regulator [Dehalococcoidia bacterium]